MQSLPLSFTRDSFDYSQLERTSRTAIYSQSKHGRVQAYVAIRVQVHPAQSFPSGLSYPDRESFPPAEAWGTDAFTCLTLPDSQHRASQLSRQLPG